MKQTHKKWMRLAIVPLVAIMSPSNVSLAGTESVTVIEPFLAVPRIRLQDKISQAEEREQKLRKQTLEVVSKEGTNYVASGLQDAASFCRQLKDEYAVDCLADRLQALARSMPETGDYAEARAALADAANKLSALSLQNEAPSLPRIRASTPATTTKPAVRTRPLVPIAPAKLASVAKQADAILAETQTILLRSAEKSERRKIPYQQIAAAMGSNKILLRSL